MIQEIKSHLGDLTVCHDLDTDKLPVFMQKTLNDFLIPLNKGTPISSLALMLLSKTAQSLGHYRINVKTSHFTVPCNLYGLIVLKTGDGKDRSVNQLDEHVFKQYGKTFEKDNKLQEKELDAKVKRDAEDKHTGKKQQNDYIASNKGRELIKEIARGTLEGLMSQRQQLQKLNIGSTFVHIKEYGSYLKTLARDEFKKEFLEIIIELYDMGNYGGKSTKENRKSGATKGIPNNFLAHTSVSAITNSKTYNLQLELNRTGFGRRMFVCFPTGEVVKQEEFKELKEKILSKNNGQEEAIRRSGDISEIFSKAFDSLEPSTMISDKDNADIKFNNSFKLDEEAEYTYAVYEEYNDIRSKKIRGLLKKDEGFVGEIKHRHWKMIKLAGLIACMNHPEDQTVRDRDVRQAIYLTEYFGGHFIQFYIANKEDNIDKLFDFIKESGGVTRMQIRKSGILDDRNFKRDFENSIGDLEDLAVNKGYELKEEKLDRNGIKYYLEELKAKEIEVDKKDFKVSCSAGINNSEKSVIMNPYVINFSDIPKLTGDNKTYSFVQYGNKKRSVKNTLQKMNALSLDVDDGLSIVDTIEILKEYKGWICTTRSHGKDKHGLTCDRFRIVLPIVEAEITNEIYKNIMPSIENHLFGKKVLDSKCFEVSRMFFGNPNQETFELKGNKILDTLMFYEKPNKDLNRKPAQVFQNTIKNAQNVDKSFDFGIYNYLKAGDTKPIKCANPAHEDKSNSGYVGRSKDSGNLFLRCSGCEYIAFEK